MILPRKRSAAGEGDHEVVEGATPPPTPRCAAHAPPRAGPPLWGGGGDPTRHARFRPLHPPAEGPPPP
jgi:hypothetical protein